jgi:REP element-mobilizing transposase RayT
VTRQIRTEYPGALWHITVRGNERRDIVRDDVDRRRFVHLLARVVEDRGWWLHAWVLMSNHFHLLVETPDVGLSRGMHWLNQRLAETFNRRHGRVGHLFQARFKAIAVEREGHLLELLRYIVLNPVRAQITRTAAAYRWSSYRATAGLDPCPSWLQVDWTLAQFHDNPATARRWFREFVNDGAASRYKPWEVVKGSCLGSADFRTRLEGRIAAQRHCRDHRLQDRRPASLEVESVALRVATELSVPTDTLRRHGRGMARKALVMIARLEGRSFTEIADWMGVSSTAASVLHDAARSLYVADRAFRLLFYRLWGKT